MDINQSIMNEAMHGATNRRLQGLIEELDHEEIQQLFMDDQYMWLNQHKETFHLNKKLKDNLKEVTDKYKQLGEDYQALAAINNTAANYIAENGLEEDYLQYAKNAIKNE
ncbi:hypothetical protein [Salibacterium qingdaonense]|uniref:Uncharacterized protein n=1 Tax=Salibacterium qingdaonense TaxID=266892 RepID=A0A1I4QM57_9BACI|nr:hypothetical protein [Salibacterium qingdaonense]SFM41127.1 hypothetical protein SAMN04488054_1458 [Salibacterium qingdaonense]